MGAGRRASPFLTGLVRCLGADLTPHVAHRNILYRICNRNILVVNRDNTNGSRATIRLVGENRHLVTSSTIRVEHASTHALVNSSPGGVHRFVRLHNVNVVGTHHLFNVNSIGSARGVGVIVDLRP